ncbi:MAG: DUF4389 domain-containing protein [Crocinitomicaceae bacterium]
MMTFDIKHQDEYSRGQLLLRAFFGVFYIMIPHGILIVLLSIGLLFVKFLTFWIILFTGKWNKGFFDYHVKMMRYQLRVQARLMNLADGYPEFGLNGTDTHTSFDITYQEDVSRGSMLLRAFFGMFYVGIPHGFILMFRMIGVFFCNFIGFWAILFTANYPKGMFDFVVKTYRWNYRVSAYLSYLTHTYPPFSGDVQPGENLDLVDATVANDEILDA